MRLCNEKVDRIQKILQSHPETVQALKRKEKDEKLDLRLLEHVEKEKKELERASKRLRQQESRAKEEVHSATQVAQTVQVQAAWKEYFACFQIEELSRFAQAEKLRADELARRISLYEHRFGHVF